MQPETSKEVSSNSMKSKTPSNEHLDSDDDDSNDDDDGNGAEEEEILGKGKVIHFHHTDAKVLYYLSRVIGKPVFGGSNQV